MTQKFYSWILKIGVFLCFISLFIINENLLFPYITSKQIYFNVIIEILFVVWVAFIFKYPEWRPKKSYMWFGLLVFFLVMIISSFTGIDFNLSFWGDIERMLGVFHLLHFLVFYFIIITVFREWKDWQILFIISIICAFFMSIKGLSGKPMSFIGNTAYVSGYLIFNMFFSWLLFLREKDKFLRWLYLIPLPVMFALFVKANTSGAFVGLGFSLMVMSFLYGILNKKKAIKIASLSLLGFLIVTTVLVFTYRDASIVKKTPVLKNVGSISIQKNTFQTRLISWRAALKDFKNQPFLGTGQGNYAITFDKYFEPTFYNYTRSETYFDRAHNNLIDILSTTGILGLVSYLSIFVALAFYLIKGYRKKIINVNEFILITSLTIAYFVQNLAVFDSMVTYMALMMMLGYVYWLSQGGLNEEGEVVYEEIKRKDLEVETGEMAIFVVLGLLMAVVLFNYNYRPFKMLEKTIDGQIAFNDRNIQAAYDEYQIALGMNTVLDRDSRTTLVRSLAQDSALLNNIDTEKANEILDFTIDQARRNVAYNSNDSLMQYQMALILDIAARFNQANPEKFQYYSDEALMAIDAAINASPGRIPVYFTKAQIYLNREEDEKAIETMEYAVSLNLDYYESTCQLSRLYFQIQDAIKGYEKMDECIDRGGAKTLSPEAYLVDLIKYYQKKGDTNRELLLREQLVRVQGNNPTYWIELAKLYAKLGQNNKAITSAEKVAQLDPEMAASVTDFIRALLTE